MGDANTYIQFEITVDLYIIIIIMSTIETLVAPAARIYKQSLIVHAKNRS